MIPLKRLIRRCDSGGSPMPLGELLPARETVLDHFRFDNSQQSAIINKPVLLFAD